MPTSETPLSALLTSSQAAELLGVTVATLATWRCTGRYPLPWVRVGRCIRYRPEDLVAFIESRLEGVPREQLS